MALGFFLGMAKGIGRVLDEKGKIVEVPAARIPKNLQAGQDFKFRSSASGEFRIAEPVSIRKTESNSPRHRQQYAMNRLMQKGWTGPQAAGIVGRFMVESFPDLRTTAIGDREIPGASHGIGQWNRERKAAMQAYATGKVPGGKFTEHPLVLAAAKASPGNRGAGNFDAQIDFFDWEIRNSPSERLAYAAVRRAKTAEDAATGMMHYERPRGYLSKAPSRGMHWHRTVKNATMVMKQYDPNYEFKSDFAANQRDLDLANMSVRDETGDMTVAERTQNSFGESQADGPPIFDTSTEDNFDSQEAPDEETMGETLGFAEEGGAMEAETVDTSHHRARIQEMIQQGQQAQMGGLPGLPTFRDLFGQG